jgi:hypothetical protein
VNRKTSDQPVDDDTLYFWMMTRRWAAFRCVTRVKAYFAGAAPQWELSSGPKVLHAVRAWEERAVVIGC